MKFIRDYTPLPQKKSVVIRGYQPSIWCHYWLVRAPLRMCEHLFIVDHSLFVNSCRQVARLTERNGGGPLYCLLRLLTLSRV